MTRLYKKPYIRSSKSLDLLRWTLNRLRPKYFILQFVKFFAVALATPAKFASFRIKFFSASLDQRHRNKSI